jgi:hypothetical protein
MKKKFGYSAFAQAKLSLRQRARGLAYAVGPCMNACRASQLVRHIAYFTLAMDSPWRLAARFISPEAVSEGIFVHIKREGM